MSYIVAWMGYGQGLQWNPAQKSWALGPRQHTTVFPTQQAAELALDDAAPLLEELAIPRTQLRIVNDDLDGFSLAVPPAHGWKQEDFRVECSWCKRELVPGVHGAPTSHSICESCLSEQRP